MKRSLNFDWKFIENFEESYLKKFPENSSKIDIPHTVKEVPYNYFNEEIYQFVSTYEKIFDVDNFNKKRRYFIKFEGFMLKARIYLNGVNLGEHVSGYLPVELEVTTAIKEKANRLVVVLDSRENNDYPPFGFAIDYQTFGGIYREVYLIDEPQTYLRNIYVHGDSKGNIDISFDKIGEEEISPEFILYKGVIEIARFNETEFHLDNAYLWDIDNPNLYTLETIIGEDKYQTRFGFRDISFKGTGFYLNGKKVKLVGLNRHQGYPFIGYAASKSLQEDDANILKNELGVNVVRTSHYSDSEHFLDRCDEIGLLVVNEIPGWQHVSRSKVWRDNCIYNAKRMVLKERNHPSLIAHGVRIDESIDDHDLYTQTNKIAHELDQYRPTIGVRNFIGSELLEDIYGLNNFVCDSLEKGLDDPKKVKVGNKPVLVTEYMGHMDPVKPTSDIEKRVEVALRHTKVINDNFKYSNLCGAIGWCFADYHTHVDFGSGDHICPHGVMDLYRNPKLSSYIYASQQDKFPVMHILSNMKPGDLPEAIFKDIYVATNCDYIELYKDNELVKRFYPLKDKFESLKHPPILIDDIVGETFKESRFPLKHQVKIAKALSYAAMHGFNHLPLRLKLYLGFMMIRYRINYSELVAYWNKYVGAWGGKAKTYTFKGYINDKVVKECSIGPSNEFDLVIEPNKTELVNEDTYDTLRIRVKHVDGFGNLMEYSNRIIEVSTTGPIELIGPSNQVLLGGQLSFFIKSKNEKGKATITFKMDEFVRSINIDVN